ncbi:MAG: GLPGLI family protein [Bacteroidia bacterium]|nr:GLPGLI family protein [Bacteroidia bacterium]
MKTTHLLRHLVLVSIASLLYITAQGGKKIQEGKVTFEISYAGTAGDEHTHASMPREAITYFNGKKTRTEISMGNGMGSQIMIADQEKGTGVMLLDMMGKKVAIISDQKDAKKPEAQKPDVAVTDETKKIAGFDCRKATVTMHSDKGKDYAFDVWFTDDIGIRNGYNSQIDGINGYMLEFESRQGAGNMKFTAKSVEEIPVGQEMFEIPKDYTVMTQEEFKKSMTGGH